MNSNNVAVIGAGSSLAQAANYYHCSIEDTLVISFGWNVIRCRYATPTTPGVNPYEYEWVAQQVKILRAQYPTSQLVAVFHWNYEFEQYPQPADREFAHYLISLGVDAIIGHHAHIIQGYEFMNGKPIFYGLGNFYFPNGVYDGFSLEFPPNTKKGLSVNIFDGGVNVYITQLLDNQRVTIFEEGKAEDIQLLQQLSMFQGMNHRDYLAFFRENRVKKKMLPIYRSYKNKLENYLYDCFVMGRQVPVDIISKLRGGSR